MARASATRIKTLTYSGLLCYYAINDKVGIPLLASLKKNNDTTYTLYCHEPYCITVS